MTDAAFNHLARSYSQLLRDEEDLTTFAALEKQFPQSDWNKESASTKSQCYFRLFLFEEPIKEAENALSGSGSKDDRLGALKRRLRQWNDGEKALQKASELYQSPEHKEEALYELAMLFFEKRTFIGASKEFQNVIASYPNGKFVPHAAFYLGRCYNLKNAAEQLLKG